MSNFKPIGGDLDALFLTHEVLDPYLEGYVLGFGANVSGQLGLLNTTGKSVPTHNIQNSNKWVQVSAGSSHFAGIKSDGTLWLCGAGTNSQLGDSTTTTKSSPVQTVATGTNWKQVAANNGNTCAIKTDGTLWIWGNGAQGALGDNTVAAKNSPIQTIATGTNWKQAISGYLSNAGIKTDGTLWLWGYNVSGQLGNNSRTNTSSPVQTICQGTNWKQLSFGHYHSAAVKTDGTLWTWGANDYGQLGDNTTIDKSSPIQTIATGTNWKQVSCGYGFAAGIKTDGTLWLWGDNTSGQLGDSTITHKSSPIQTIAGGNNWKQVSCGAQQTIAIKTDGSAWAWGYNNSGQLGDNTTTSKSSPVQVTGAGNIWKQISCGATSTAFLILLKE
jgi:alpha-tubulin suppressor-like RCC1 family protein